MKLRWSQFLWQQLNGLQATAIIQSIFLFFQNLITPIFDYFDCLDIARANTYHLNLFGLILRVPRPVVWNSDDPYWLHWFRFDDPDPLESTLGFSAPDDPAYVGVGGLLSYEYTEYSDPARIRVDPAEYREMLLAATSGGGMLGSLALLDHFVSVFFEPSEYTITQPSSLSPGDILVTLNKVDEIAYTALLSIAQLWLPNTHIAINMIIV